MSEAIETPGASAPAEHGAEVLLPDVRIRPDSLLRAEHLVKRYGKRRVVDDVSLEVHPGEVVGLLGPNGAGKTTTFYMIVGLIKHSRGTIYLDGEEITYRPLQARGVGGIGYLSPSRRYSAADRRRHIRRSRDVPARSRGAERASRDRLDELVCAGGGKPGVLFRRRSRRLNHARMVTQRATCGATGRPCAGVDRSRGSLQPCRVALDRGLGI